MNRKVRAIINHLTAKPKTLFLIDGLGAMLTAFILYFLLRNYNEYFGIPIILLTCLSVLAVCFSLYSIACSFFLKGTWFPFIIAISICNLLYCILTIVLVAVYRATITIAGTTYFFVEIVIICALVYIEYNVAKEIKG